MLFRLLLLAFEHREELPGATEKELPTFFQDMHDLLQHLEWGEVRISK